MCPLLALYLVVLTVSNILAPVQLEKSMLLIYHHFNLKFYLLKPLTVQTLRMGNYTKALKNTLYKDTSIRGFQPFQPYREPPSAVYLLS